MLRFKKLTPLIITLILSIYGSTALAGNTATANILDLQLDLAFDAFQQGRYEDAKTIWQRLADQGMTSAQVNLAALYDSGKGTVSDPVKAAGLYRHAADQGHPFAQYNLALMLIEGRGISRDLQSAETYLKKAADQDIASAHYQLGRLYAGHYGQTSSVDDLSLSTSTPDPSNLGRALDHWYQSGLKFDQELDTAGLKKTIAAMRRTAPRDPRIASLQTQYRRLHKGEMEADGEQNAPPTAFGTAWPLENGYVVTNYHVVAGSRSLTLQATDGRQFKARTVLCDQDNDLALLAVADTDQLPPGLPLCRNEAATGDAVFTLGFPRVDTLGYTPKFAGGVIEEDNGAMGSRDRFLTTVDIQPGNSGGPLLNNNGEVVGVVAAMVGVRDEASGKLQILQDKSLAIKIGNLHHLIGQLPENGVRHRTINGYGLPLSTLRNVLQKAVLVVIARGENG